MFRYYRFNSVSYFSLNCLLKPNSAGFFSHMSASLTKYFRSSVKKASLHLDPQGFKVFLVLWQIFQPELTLRFVATFVVRISPAFLDQLSNKFRSHFIWCRERLISVVLFVDLSLWIFQMHLFQVWQRVANHLKRGEIRSFWNNKTLYIVFTS